MLNDTHIVSIMIGDSEKRKVPSDLPLNRQGIYIQPMNYPTVPKEPNGAHYADPVSR